MNLDREIFIGYRGKMTKVAEPKGNAERANFVITYKGKDWSGFRTLADCQRQFPELEKRSKTLDDFAVVERL